MRVLDIALKNILQVVRDKSSLLFLVLMPVIFTVAMGFLFGSTGAAEETRLKVGWVNRDGNSSAAQQLQAQVRSVSSLELVELPAETPQSLEARVRSGELAAVLTVPAGFGAAYLEGAQPQLVLLANTGQPDGEAAAQAVRSAVIKALSAVEMGKIAVEMIDPVQPFANEQARSAELDTSVRAAGQALQTPPFTLAMEAVSNLADKSNPFTQTSPGIMVQFVLFGLNNSAMVIILERRSKTLQRLLTTSLSRSAALAGHFLSMFALIIVQEVILIVFGQLVLGVEYFRQPLAVAIVAVALALWVAALGMLIGVTARNEDQVTLFSLIAMFLFSALGGSWFPLEGASRAFVTIGHLTPTAWAMDGFQNIVQRGLGLESVLLPAAVILAYAAAIFALAAWRFQKTI